jgi:S-adenosylmethionine decarboxylase
LNWGQACVISWNVGDYTWRWSPKTAGIRINWNYRKKQLIKKLAKHFIADLFERDRDILDDTKIVEQVLLNAAEAAGVTIVGHSFHKHAPQGVSGVVLMWSNKNGQRVKLTQWKLLRQTSY